MKDTSKQTQAAPSGVNIRDIYNANSDRLLGQAFSWLARIGAGPKFGSRPIGWYQAHMCHALDSLRATGGTHARMRGGIIQIFVTNNGWQNFGTPSALFNTADSLSRK